MKWLLASYASPSRAKTEMRLMWNAERLKMGAGESDLAALSLRHGHPNEQDVNTINRP